LFRVGLISVFASAALTGCIGFPEFGAEPPPGNVDDAFGSGPDTWDENDRLLGMTPAEAAEVMDGHWVEDDSVAEPILISNDALLLDDLDCFESASFDGESRLVASFSCRPQTQGIRAGRILITGGTDGFQRRIAELDIVGDDIVAETEPVTFEEIYLVAQFRRQVIIEPQPLQMAPAGERDLTVNANWTVYDQQIDGLDHRIKLGGKAVLRGVLDYDFDIRLCSPAWWMPPYPCADYRAAAGLDTDLELRIVLEIGKAFSWGQDYPLPFNVPVATFPLGGLPVLVEISLQPSLFWQVTAGAKVAAQIGVEADMLAMIGVGGTVPGPIPDNLSGVEFSNVQLQPPRFDEILSARARVGFKFAIVTSFNRTLDLTGSVSPYVQAVATADCDEIDLALQYGVQNKLGVSLGWGSFSLSANWDVGGLGPYDLVGTSVPVEGLLTGDSDCIGDDDPGVATEESFLPELPHATSSTSELWFQDHLEAMDQSLADYDDELADLHAGIPQFLTRDVAFSTDGQGYWTLDEDGVVTAFGSAEHHCDMPEEMIENHEPQGIVPRPAGDGYWIYTASGRVMSCSYGEVDNQDDLTAMGEGAVVDMAAYAGGGYWLLEADGDVHAFEGAPDYGSAELSGSADRAVSLIPVPFGGGYRILTLERDLFGFGSAAALSAEDLALLQGPDIEIVADMAELPDGGLVAVDGWGRLFGLAGADESLWEGWSPVDNPHALALTPSGLGGVVLTEGGALAAWGDVPH
jgi:hypothetical protein